MPKTAGDMPVIGTSKDGKLIYSWGEADKGRVTVEVTPRKGREPVDPKATEYKQHVARETTITAVAQAATSTTARSCSIKTLRPVAASCHEPLCPKG